MQIPHECEAPFGRPLCIRHPSNPEDRGLDPAEAIVLVRAQMQVYAQVGPTIFGRLLIKDFLLFNIPHIAGASLHLLCVVFIFYFYFSSSDIPELWLLLCLDRNFSSWQSWFFYCTVPVDAIFLFICTGMVSYILISKLIPSFLLYFQKIDISFKTMLLSVGITEQPLQMFRLSFLQEPVPNLCPEFIS